MMNALGKDSDEEETGSLSSPVAYRVIASGLLGLSVISLVLALDLFGAWPSALASPRLAVKADAALRQGVIHSSSDQLNEASRLTDLQASQSPMDSRIALRRSQIFYARSGRFDEQVLLWLKTSFEHAPYDASIELPRAVLALNGWDHLSPELRRMTIANVREAFRRSSQRAQVLKLESKIINPSGRMAYAAAIGAERATGRMTLSDH